MTLFARVRLRAVCLHLREILRSGLNAQITQAIAESPSSAPSTNLATIADTTAQIVFGDNTDYEPLIYPSIRVATPVVAYRPFGSASATSGELTLVVAIYTEQVASSGLCVDDTIITLTETTLDLVECVRATVERDYPSMTYGSQILATQATPVDAPQDPESPCVLRQKYELNFTASTRLRQSRGATT
jgi:hypothetical protein